MLERNLPRSIVSLVIANRNSNGLTEDGPSLFDLSDIRLVSGRSTTRCPSLSSLSSLTTNAVCDSPADPVRNKENSSHRVRGTGKVIGVVPTAVEAGSPQHLTSSLRSINDVGRTFLRRTVGHRAGRAG